MRRVGFRHTASSESGMRWIGNNGATCRLGGSTRRRSELRLELPVPSALQPGTITEKHVIIFGEFTFGFHARIAAANSSNSSSSTSIHIHILSAPKSTSFPSPEPNCATARTPLTLLLPLLTLPPAITFCSYYSTTCLPLSLFIHLYHHSIHPTCSALCRPFPYLGLIELLHTPTLILPPTPTRQPTTIAPATERRLLLSLSLSPSTTTSVNSFP